MKTVKGTSAIINLLIDVKKFKKISNKQIGLDAGLQKYVKDVEAPVRHCFNRKRMIHIDLVDWVLQQTLFSKNNIECAISCLRAEGLNDEQCAAVRAIIQQFKVGIPPPAQTIVPAPADAPTTPIPASSHAQVNKIILRKASEHKPPGTSIQDPRYKSRTTHLPNQSAAGESPAPYGRRKKE